MKIVSTLILAMAIASVANANELVVKGSTDLGVKLMLINKIETETKVELVTFKIIKAKDKKLLNCFIHSIVDVEKDEDFGGFNAYSQAISCKPVDMRDLPIKGFFTSNGKIGVTNKTIGSKSEFVVTNDVFSERK